MELRGTAPLTADVAQRYLYNGKEQVEGTGLYDYGARWYDPATARWGQVDPLADQFAAWSPYNYVLGNPISLVDPDGAAPQDHIFYLVIQKGAKVNQATLASNTQSILNANGINQRVQIIEVSGSVDVKQYYSNKDRTDAITFVGDQGFIEDAYGDEMKTMGYSAWGIGFLNLDRTSSVFASTETNNESGHLARIAIHEGIGHPIVGGGHTDNNEWNGNYPGYLSPGENQSIMTSGNGTKFSEDPLTGDVGLFIPELIPLIKKVIPDQRPGFNLDWHLTPTTLNVPKDNLTKRLQQ